LKSGSKFERLVPAVMRSVDLDVLDRRGPRLVLEDERGLQSRFYPSLTQEEAAYIDGWKKGSILGSSRAPAAGLATAREMEGLMALGPAQLDGYVNVASARRVLRDLDRHYARLARRGGDGPDLEEADGRDYFNANLLYLVAIMENSENSLIHSQFVAGYTLLLARAVGIENIRILAALEQGALLHDIGKVGLPSSILRKAGPLTVVEQEIVRDHPALGYSLVQEFQFLEAASEIVLHHHEHYDGRGYPFGLSGQEIPLSARLFALADTLDAITSDRPYRKGRPFWEARREIERGRGTQFDPAIVDIFLALPQEQWLEVRQATEKTFRAPAMH